MPTLRSALSLSSHLHLGNAAIHNSSVVQFGRFSEYVIAPSYTVCRSHFPIDFVLLPLPRPLRLSLFLVLCRGATMPRAVDVSSILHRVGAALTSITRR